MSAKPSRETHGPRARITTVVASCAAQSGSVKHASWVYARSRDRRPCRPDSRAFICALPRTSHHRCNLPRSRRLGPSIRRAAKRKQKIEGEGEGEYEGAHTVGARARPGRHHVQCYTRSPREAACHPMIGSAGARARDQRSERARAPKGKRGRKEGATDGASGLRRR